MKPQILLSLFLFCATLYAQTSSPTVAEAEQFMNQAEARLAELSVKVNTAAPDCPVRGPVAVK